MGRHINSIFYGKRGYYLKRRAFPTPGNGAEKRYAIVNQDNLLIAGEYTMSLDDVEKWVLESE